MENTAKKKVSLFKDKRGLEDSFQFLIKTFIFVTLFAMILFVVIIYMGTNYNKDSTEVLQGMNVQGLNNTVNGFQAQADAWRGNLGSNSSSIISQAIGTVTTALDSVFFIGSSMFTFITIPFNLISGIIVNVLGVPNWIATVIEALIIITGIFGLIRLIKWGA